jgi:hypothetical protein
VLDLSVLNEHEEELIFSAKGAARHGIISSQRAVSQRLFACFRKHCKVVTG